MNKPKQYSEEQIRKSIEVAEAMTQMFVNGLKNAKKLGIEDMTQSEAESYLKEKETKKDDKDDIIKAGLPISDKALAIATQLVGAYMNKGIYKIEEILLDIYLKYKDNFEKLFNAIKGVYGFILATNPQEGMTELSVVQSLKPDDIVREAEKQIKENQEKENQEKENQGKEQGKEQNKETPHKILATNIFNILESGGMIKDNPALTKLSNEAFGGSIAEGKYTIQDSYDALETGINMYIAAHPNIYSNTEYPLETLKEIRDLMNRIPTQTGRTQEKDDFQQYSTPPTIGYTMHYLANVNKGDTILEPSAGNGGLIVFSKDTAKNIIANEIYERRREMLKLQGYETRDYDAMFINDFLATEENTEKPTIVIMNPPFSATGGKSKNDTKNGLKHISQALSRLQDGGRAIILFGEGLAFDKVTKSEWWDKIMDRYNVRANVTLNGEEYRKYGTTFGNQLIVIDKSGNTPGNNKAEKLSNVVYGEMTLEEVIVKLKNIRDDRPTIQNSVPKSDRGGTGKADGNGTGGTGNRLGSDLSGGRGGSKDSKPGKNDKKDNDNKPGDKDKETDTGATGSGTEVSDEPDKRNSGEFATIEGVDKNEEALQCSPLVPKVYPEPSGLRLRNVQKNKTSRILNHII